MSGKKIVCNGALCKCQFGDVPDSLVVSSQNKNYVNDSTGSQKLIATDKELGMPFQAKTFGQCKLQPTGSSFKPCMPSITGWTGQFEKMQLQANQGFPLLEDSKATCAIAGSPCVEITFHGQTATPSAQNVKNADEEVLAQILPMLNVQEIQRPSPYDAISHTAEEIDEEDEEPTCEDQEPSKASSSIIGTCKYYKWRFENFMERHDDCEHDPPDYYYGPLRKIHGGYGVLDGLNEWWTPSVEEEMENEKLKKYKRKNGDYRGVPSKSYGYKYCVRFTKVLMPSLSREGQLWLTKAKENLQIYIEQGICQKDYLSVYNQEFNQRYNLPLQADSFYTGLEKRGSEFRDFAFATHPDAYLEAGLTSIPISDKIKVSLTPDFKEWGKGDTWEQAMIVMEEQIDDWYKQAEQGIEAAQKVIQEAVKDAEKYLELYQDAKDIWNRVNRELDKYRRMPWLN